MNLIEKGINNSQKTIKNETLQILL